MSTRYMILLALAVTVGACTKAGEEDPIPSSRHLEFIVPDYPAWEATSTRTTTDPAGRQHWAADDTLFITIWWSEGSSYTPTREADATYSLIYTGSSWKPDGACIWPYDVPNAFIRADYYGGPGKGGNYPDPLYDEVTAHNSKPVVLDEFQHTNARCIFTGRPAGWALEIYEEIDGEQQLYQSLPNPSISGPDTLYMQPREGDSNKANARNTFLLFPADAADKGPFNTFSYRFGTAWTYDLRAIVSSYEGKY